MHESDTPPEHPGGQDSPPEAIGAADAEDILRQVVIWYSQRIARERRSTHPDEDRLAELMREQQAAVADQQALADAGPEQRARIAADYVARYQQLRQQ